MSTAASQCLLHPDREAVARCPECRQPCCRECVTEHEGRFLCATCLKRRTRPAAGPAGRLWLEPVLLPVQVLAGLALAALVFAGLGMVLLQIPAEWHEGTRLEREVGGP